MRLGERIDIWLYQPLENILIMIQTPVTDKMTDKFKVLLNLKGMLIQLQSVTRDNTHP